MKIEKIYAIKDETNHLVFMSTSEEEVINKLSLYNDFAALSLMLNGVKKQYTRVLLENCTVSEKSSIDLKKHNKFDVEVHNNAIVLKNFTLQKGISFPIETFEKLLNILGGPKNADTYDIINFFNDRF